MIRYPCRAVARIIPMNRDPLCRSLMPGNSPATSASQVPRQLTGEALPAPAPPASLALARPSRPRFNGPMPETRHKITFGEMRAAGVRGLLTYIAPISAAAIGRQSAATDGPMMFGYPTITCENLESRVQQRDWGE
jgi:hypothetical protein